MLPLKLYKKMAGVFDRRFFLALTTISKKWRNGAGALSSISRVAGSFSQPGRRRRPYFYWPVWILIIMFWLAAVAWTIQGTERSRMSVTGWQPTPASRQIRSIFLYHTNFS